MVGVQAATKVMPRRSEDRNKFRRLRLSVAANAHLRRRNRHMAAALALVDRGDGRQRDVKGGGNKTCEELISQILEVERHLRQERRMHDVCRRPASLHARTVACPECAKQACRGVDCGGLEYSSTKKTETA